MNFVDEPLPVLLILPSSANEPRIRLELITRMHQVKGCYGFNDERQFSCMIRTSEKGSMTKDILNDYLNYLFELYPDISDEKGSRFLFKLDSGPG